MFIDQAQYYAKKSTCIKRQVGCVVVKDNKVIAYGFNHGYNELCTCSLDTKNPDVLHAEEMALMGSDKEIYVNSDIYVTYQPCMKCAEIIVNNRIKNVYIKHLNQCSQSIQYLNENNISTYVLE